MKTARHCLCWLIPEAEGIGYSIISATLPGAVSQGETMLEALDNMKSAFAEIIGSYEENGEVVPWQNSASESPYYGALRCTVLVYEETKE